MKSAGRLPVPLPHHQPLTRAAGCRLPRRIRSRSPPNSPLTTKPPDHHGTPDHKDATSPGHVDDIVTANGASSSEAVNTSWAMNLADTGTGAPAPSNIPGTPPRHGTYPTVPAILARVPSSWSWETRGKSLRNSSSLTLIHS